MPDAKSWWGGLALLVLAGSPGLAQAPDPLPQLSTGVLAALCGASGTDADSMTAQGYCRGFIVGVGQYHIEITRPGGIMPAFCLPQPAPTLDFVQSSFVAWVAANPDQAETKAVDGLMRWAANTYPCAAPARRRGAR
ncbi:Rap1a/Tai family immunity protein [Sediminicoccus sp. BL-A-41-H5]|uniref:Rap1a/Tai family immunity protein n=1 Tax=Sediminicoccus sp. BL-A-41-H5 TaxID=3421106 RepID=UPI003D67EF9E